MKNNPSRQNREFDAGYESMLQEVLHFIETTRRSAARSINTVMTAAYWMIGRRIVEQEQQGGTRARYGKFLLKRLSEDLTRRFGKGFSVDNLELMRAFYAAYPSSKISETLSRIYPDH